MGAGKAWSDLECLFDSQAFVWASEDPVRGSGQKSLQLQKRVQEQCERLVANHRLSESTWNSPERSGSAITQTYQKIKRECLLLEVHIATAKSFKPTGDPDEEDFVRLAVAMHNGRANGTTDFYRTTRGAHGNEPSDIGPEPYFLKSYRFLITTSLWMSLRAVTASIPSIGRKVHGF
jgi:hypothetical protein